MKRKLIIILICTLLITLIIILLLKAHNLNTITTINRANNSEVKENLIDDSNLEKTEIIDINNIKNEYYSKTGKITEIKDNVINFLKTDKEKYKITISDKMDLIDARTEEKIEDISSIKIGDVIDIYINKEEIVVGIAKDLSGEALKNDLLINLSLKEPKLNTYQIPGVEKINIINKEKAVVTIVFSDMYGEYFNNKEEFKKDVIVNSSTKIHSKSGLAYNVETLKNAIDGFIIIVLDRKTINNNEPIVIYYGQSDT